MRGDEQVLEFLNEQLSAELTAINQYFLHARMQANLGWVKLAAHTRAESIDEMRHAEMLTERILFLEGLPNYQRLGALSIGQTVQEMFEADLQIEIAAIDRLRRGIEHMQGVADHTSRMGSGTSTCPRSSLRNSALECHRPSIPSTRMVTSCPGSRPSSPI